MRISQFGLKRIDNDEYVRAKARARAFIYIYICVKKKGPNTVSVKRKNMDMRSKEHSPTHIHMVKNKINRIDGKTI